MKIETVELTKNLLGGQVDDISCHFIWHLPRVVDNRVISQGIFSWFRNPWYFIAVFITACSCLLYFQNKTRQPALHQQTQCLPLACEEVPTPHLPHSRITCEKVWHTSWWGAYLRGHHRTPSTVKVTTERPSPSEVKTISLRTTRSLWRRKSATTWWSYPSELVYNTVVCQACTVPLLCPSWEVCSHWCQWCAVQWDMWCEAPGIGLGGHLMTFDKVLAPSWDAFSYPFV